MSSNTTNTPKSATLSNEVSATPQKKEEKQKTRHELYIEMHRDAQKLMRSGSYAGFLFLHIRDKELWREGGFESWNHYCEMFLEASRGQINRVIRHAATYYELSKSEPPLKPNGDKVLPTAESQTRPLLKLPDVKLRAQAWRDAVKRADGLPTAKIVTEAVAEIIGEAPPKAQKPRAKKRLEVIKQLRDAARSRDSWERIEELIKVLEKLETPKTRAK